MSKHIFVDNSLKHTTGLVLNGGNIDFEGNNPHPFSASKPRLVV
jgi:hypothetical protein